MRTLYPFIIIALISLFSGCNTNDWDEELPAPFTCNICFFDNEGNDLVKTLQRDTLPEGTIDTYCDVWKWTYTLACPDLDAEDISPIRVDVGFTPNVLLISSFIIVRYDEQGVLREIPYRLTYPSLFGDEEEHSLVAYFKGQRCYHVTLDGEAIPVKYGVATVRMEK